MSDLDQANRGSPARWLGLFAGIFGSILMLGMVVGFASAAWRGPSGPELRDYAILAAMLAAAIALLVIVWRTTRQLFGSAVHIPRRERLSRNILIGCGAIGLAIGIILSVTTDIASDGSGSAAGTIFSNTSIPPTLAIGLAAVLLFIVPAASYYWHGIIDEHEREAYVSGALAAGYFYMLAAPAWWLLWRGGLLPAPSGVGIYLAFNFIFTIVWLWKKYR